MYLVHIRKRKLKRNNMAEVVEKKKNGTNFRISRNPQNRKKCGFFSWAFFLQLGYCFFETHIVK